MIQDHPFLEDIHLIRWNRLTPDRVGPDIEAALESAAKALHAIEGLPKGSENFANTFLALESAISTVSQPWAKVNHLTEVKDSPDLRSAHGGMLPKVSAFMAEIPLNQILYQRLKSAASRPESAQLDAVERRYMAEVLKDFEEAGANLPDALRQRLREIESELAEKTKNYAENVLDSTNAYQLILESASELDGLPDSLIEAARLDALKRGIGSEETPRYRLSLQSPSSGPAMRFVHSESIRKELYQAMCRVGHSSEYENEPLIRDILRLRREKARLLGRANFPDWVLTRRMARSGSAALGFIAELHEKTKSAFDAEVRELMAFKARETGQPESLLHPWEFAYWSERMRKGFYAFDEEELRPYFQMPSVIQGFFALVERLFGIHIEELPTGSFEYWHPEVRAYKVFDSADGRHLGSFYSDWHPRDEKRGGAWMGPLVTGSPRPDGSLSPHLGYVIGNLSAPVGNKPALLTHREVETVFHEFGHLLHHVLSEVKIRSLSGTNVAWDFVELPSQIMENWCWERDSLDLFARHYETGEPIPEALFQKMKKARNFGAARMQMGQLAYGRLDLLLHSDFDPDGDADLDDFLEAALKDYRAPTSESSPTIVRSFSHLFSESTGYAAGYYSYKWAEVLDADAFTRFAAEGIMNEQTGRAFREHILSKGNSEEPHLLFRAFMGRDPDPEALQRRLGLLPAAG